MLHRILILFAGLLLLALAPRTAQASSAGSGCMPVSGIVSGLEFSEFVNAGFNDLIANNAGASAPVTACGGITLTGQLWYNTGATYPAFEIWDGGSFLSFAAIDPVNHIYMPLWGGGIASAAAAATLDLCGVPQNYLSITGGGTISGFGASCVTGQAKFLTVTAQTVLAYNAAAILTPQAANLVLQPNDQAVALYLGAGVWRVASVTRFDGSPASPSPRGDVRLVYSSTTTVTLQPRGGNLLTVAGVALPVPSGGITASISNCFVNGVAAQTLAANTLYYVYAFVSGGALALDFSTTGHATDTAAGNIGVEIKSGDNSRTLVGMVYPQSGPVFAGSGANQLVLSWFNRQKLVARSAFTANRSVTSTSYPGVEINSEIRCQYLVWNTLAASVAATGTMVSAQDTLSQTLIDFDGSKTADIAAIANQNSTPAYSPFGMSIGFTGPYTGSYEGAHYVTLFGFVSNTSNYWLGSGSAGERTTLEADVDG